MSELNLDELRRERDALKTALRRYYSSSEHAPDCASQTCRQCMSGAGTVHDADFLECDCGVPELLADAGGSTS